MEMAHFVATVVEREGGRKERETDRQRETRYSIVGGRLGIFDCEAETELHIITRPAKLPLLV